MNQKIVESIDKLKKAASLSSLYSPDKKIVIARGNTSENPEALFIGEAPGKTENEVGKPFVGKSGQLLDKWIKEAGIKSYVILNAVPLIPLDGNNIRAPTDEEINYFMPFTKAFVGVLNPKKIVLLGKSAAKFMNVDIRVGEWQNNIGFIYHPAYYLRGNGDGVSDFLKLFPQNYLKELTYEDVKAEDVIKNFVKDIGARQLSDIKFDYNGSRWFVDIHPFDHSDDIIILENDVNNYDNFLLVKAGAGRVRIPGWCTKEQLLSTPKRDIYRNGKFYYMVVDTNLKNLSYFKISSIAKKKKQLFIINKQTADNLGSKEMISGILSGLHSFTKQAGMFFKDINQKDECFLADKKVKIYTRDAHSDEDMLIYEKYYKEHPEIDIYILCKIKGGSYWYVGYVKKEVVDNTRIVQMIGQDGDSASNDIRRIFAEQYLPIGDLIEIFEEEKNEEEIVVEQNYIPLHQHSEWSIGDGFGTVKYISEQLRKKGFKGAALTDHGTLAGAWEFQKAMLEQGLKPIIGVEIYLKISESDKRMHTTVLIKNEVGWKNILKILSIAVRDDFYYKPIVKFDNLIKYGDGLIVTTGCADGPIHAALFAGQEDLAEKYYKSLKERFGEDFYAEFQLHRAMPKHQEVMKKAFFLCRKFNVKPIFTSDSHYPLKSDKDYQEAIKSIGLRKKYGEAGFGDDCFYLMQDDDINKRIKDFEECSWFANCIEEMKKNTFEIMEKISFEIKSSGKIDTLPKSFPTKEERKQALIDHCLAGLEKYTPYKYEGKTKERLDLEINRFVGKDYENYFLIAEDMIKWAKSNGIMVGPGRGSVGASLAAYAMNITECDPMKFELLFDRFISEIRRDAPDADIDYQDDRRIEVFDYLRKKYGINHCAKIATYARFHPKGILRDMGRIFDIPIGKIEKVCSVVLERSGGDARASFSLFDTFSEFDEAKEFRKEYPKAVEIAIKLEGHIRHKGVHAAAMVISDEDMNDYVPIGKINDEIVTEWEKQLVEDIGLIKFDILGLKTLTVISDCIKDTGILPPKEFDDKRIYDEVFKNGETTGIFQFETTGLSKLCRTLGADNFQTLYDATTLFRPGALHCIAENTLIDTTRGKKKIQELKQNEKIKCYIRDGKRSGFEYRECKRNGFISESNVYRVKTEDGEIEATDEHRFYTKSGWKMLKNLKVNDEILMCINPSKTKFKKDFVPWNKGIEWEQMKRFDEKNPNYKHGLSYGSVYRKTRSVVEIKFCEVCGVKEDLQVHHKDKNRKNNISDNLEVLCVRCHAKYHYNERGVDVDGRFL